MPGLGEEPNGGCERPAPPPYEVVHSLPGRVRIRVRREDVEKTEAWQVLLAGHPSVAGARWNPAARSLTVAFSPDASFEDLVETCPGPPGPDGATRGEEPRPPPLWRQFMAPAASLLAAFSGAGLLVRAAIVACGLPILRRAVRSLLDRKLSIDVLDLVAVTLLLATGDTLAAGVSVALVETGERIRRSASGRTRRVLRDWMGANPRGVRVQRNGSEPRVPVESVGVGHRVVVYAGETVPVDGLVVSGWGLLDTRTWTGEPLPRDVSEGGAVLAGSALADGRLVVEVTAAGSETRAGRLAAALEEAIAADTRVSDLARRIADRFVAPVLAASGLALAVTRDVPRMVSIVTFDFGTGVRIGIPTTVLTTMLAGARQGVLFKSGRSLEELARADTVVFDKTGTLTSGTPAVVEVAAAGAGDGQEALRLAAAAEGHLPHPIARAIRRAARARGLQLPESEWVRYSPGGGVEANVEGRRVLVGDRSLLADRGVEVPLASVTGSLVVLVAVEGVYVARIRLRDRIKRTAAATIARLRGAGVRRLWLASGDRGSAAAAVARGLGLDGYAARLMPEDKVALIRRLRERGSVVAMVGDGINDAGAMAESNVSVAVPRGADLVRETADVVLLTEDLNDLVTAVRLSRNAMGIVRQNVGLVAAPNSVGMLLAGLGQLSPLAATVLHNGATLCAALNALRPLLRPRFSET